MTTAQTHTDPLDPAAVLETLASLLPRHGHLSSTQPGALATPQDGLAAVLHAALTRLDFRLVGIDEDGPLPKQAASPSDIASDTAATAASVANALPVNAWNAKGPEAYTLRYRHDQSSLTFLLKLLRMSSRVLINASAVEDHKTATLEIVIADYISTSFYPWPPKQQAEAADAGSSSSSSLPAEPLVHGFISSSRLKDLLLLFKGKVIQKLIPGLRKDGYEESPAEDDSQRAGSSSRSAANADQQQQPRPPPPRNTDPDSEYDGFLPGRGGGGIMPGRNPLAIGDRDLQPLGGMRPPGAGGGLGGAFGPPPLFGGGGGGGGMFAGPDDPIFRDRFGSGAGGQQPRGPWGGDGFLPPGAVPPGARFDPIGPWGGPGGGLGRGQGQPGRGGGAPPGTRSGDPDWDDVRPPGGNSDYDNMFM